MPSVTFKYDLQKDIWNVLRVINNPPENDPTNLERPLGTISRDFVKKVRQESDTREKENLVSQFLNNEYAKNKDLIEERIKLFTTQWESKNETYFKKLETILQINLPKETAYTGYLTSAGSCPFNASQNWFMVRIEDEIADAIAAHEILHIEFRIKYSLYCRDVLKLNPKEFGNIQEATTFLLNEEMGNLLSRPDYGYKEHQKLRKALTEEWRKNKDFKHLLDYYANTKENY